MGVAAISFSHQRLAYELGQIVPLAVIIVVGVILYTLGRSPAGRGNRAGHCVPPGGAAGPAT